MKITNPITLDVARSNSYICLLAKQFDENSRFLIATLTNNGKPMIIPAGATVTLRATRPDGEPVAVPGIINNDGTTTVEIDDYILEVVGSASLSIEVAIGDEILTSASFNLTIQRADGNGWLRVYVAAASLAAGNYYITIGDTPYAFTTTQAIPAGGSVYFASEGGTAQTRDASGNVLDASLPVTIASTGTELTSDVPTMSFLTAIAGRMATIEAEMSQKANIDGSYPLLNAGTANNLMTDNGATQAIPFIQEGTGKGNGEATVKAGGVLQLKKKLGNTVCVNQLANNYLMSVGTTSTSGGITTITPSGSTNRYAVYNSGIYVQAISGHKYLQIVEIKSDGTHDVGFQNYLISGTLKTKSASWTTLSIISEATTSETVFIQLYSVSNTEYYIKENSFVVIDLTLWFGGNGRIPSDLLSHPENWGRYYAGSLAYNAGTLESADGTVMRSIGRNQLPSGSFPGTITGYANTLAEAQRTAILDCLKRLQKITAKVHYIVDADKTGTYVGELDFYAGGSLKKGLMPGSSWDISSFNFDEITNILVYGTSPAQTINFTDATISIYYEGESGYNQTYPYSVLAEVDTGSEVLRSAGSVADEKTPDGTITRRVGVVDLGTLNWGYTTSYSRGVFYTDLTDRKAYTSGMPNFASSLYCRSDAGGPSALADMGNMLIGATSGTTQILITNDSYNTAAAFKTAMSGIYLYYELATPTTEQGTAFAENIPCDPDGTLNWTQSAGVPQGNEIFYPADLKGALESIVAALPSANGTYTLHATVTTAGVTFSWS